VSAEPFLAEVARHLVSDLFRVVRDDDGLQLDFMATIHGISSFASLKESAEAIRVGNATLMVASLADVIREQDGGRAPARSGDTGSSGEDPCGSEPGEETSWRLSSAKANATSLNRSAGDWPFLSIAACTSCASA
jgi:hypothetical protein